MTSKATYEITDEQIAEIEALANVAHISRSGHEWFSNDDCWWWTGKADEGDFMAVASPNNILALISRLRGAERDAGRYRWLRKNVCMGCPSPEGSHYKDAYLVVTGYGYEESGDITDAAVDEAAKGDQQ